MEVQTILTDYVIKNALKKFKHYARKIRCNSSDVHVVMTQGRSDYQVIDDVNMDEFKEFKEKRGRFSFQHSFELDGMKNSYFQDWWLLSYLKRSFKSVIDQEKDIEEKSCRGARPCLFSEATDGSVSFNIYR